MCVECVCSSVCDCVVVCVSVHVMCVSVHVIVCVVLCVVCACVYGGCERVGLSGDCVWCV